MHDRYASMLDSSLSSFVCKKWSSGSNVGRSGFSAICEYSDRSRGGFGGGAGPTPANAAIISMPSQRYRSFQLRGSTIALEEGFLFSSSTWKITFVMGLPVQPGLRLDCVYFRSRAYSLACECVRCSSEQSWDFLNYFNSGKGSSLMAACSAFRTTTRRGSLDGLDRSLLDEPSPSAQRGRLPANTMRRVSGPATIDSNRAPHYCWESSASACIATTSQTATFFVPSTKAPLVPI